MAENGSFLKRAIVGYIFFPYALFVLWRSRDKEADKQLLYHATQSFFLWVIGILLTFILGKVLRILGELAAFLTITGAVYAVVKLLRNEDIKLPFVGELADKMINQK